MLTANLISTAEVGFSFRSGEGREPTACSILLLEKVTFV
jgi:hypothetical protein